MTTGIKAIDKLIDSYPIQRVQSESAFQKVTEVYGKDQRIAQWKMPWCMYNKIMQHKEGQRLYLHVFYLPYRKVRLASFLVDELGTVIEQVDYLRERKMVLACQKLRKLIQLSYNDINQAA